MMKTGYLIRPFGQDAADIDVDFQQPCRPLLVTQVLQYCTQKEDGEEITEGFFQDLPVGERIKALLAIDALTTRGTTESPGLLLRLHCQEETCNELIEIEITKEEILAAQSKEPGNDTGIYPIPINGKEYFFRKPTGRDQLEWLKSTFTDERTAAETIIRTLWVPSDENKSEPEPSFTGEGVEAVNDRMRNIDPLVHFELTVHCPVCNHENHYVPDLECLLIQKLHKVQLDLLQTIHRLASHYHWSEQQILAISPHRRAYYLTLVEKEKTV